MATMTKSYSTVVEKIRHGRYSIAVQSKEGKVLSQIITISVLN